LTGCHPDGKGVARDLKRAARGFRLASEQGDPESQYILSQVYADGQGVDRDDKEVEELLRLAASSGLDKARQTLGRLLLMKSAEKLKPDAD
jgi:TPR repeat protein